MEAKGVDVQLPIPRMTYAEAIRRYGVDNPDVRFGLELVELTDIVKGSGFKVFADVAAGGGIIKGSTPRDAHASPARRSTISPNSSRFTGPRDSPMSKLKGESGILPLPSSLPLRKLPT